MVTKNSILKTFYIKEVHIRVFYEYISELNAIPDTKSKLKYLKALTRRSEKIIPTRILLKHFVDRIVFGEPPKIKVLPLTTDENSNETSYQVNLPQIDLLISKGLNDPKLRQQVEDFIYSTKGIIHRLICDFANCENIFKIPKTDLKEFIETPRLRISNCKIEDMEILSETFVGYNSEYLKNYSFVPQSYLDSDKVNLLPSFKAVQVFTKKFFRDNLKSSGLTKGKRYDYIIQQGIPSSYKYVFPAMVFYQDEQESPLYYFIRRDSLTYTNMVGMMKQWFLFLNDRIKHFSFAGYYKKDTFYTVVCTYNEMYVRHMLEGKAGKYHGNPTSYLNGYNDFVERYNEKKDKYNTIPPFKVARKYGQPLMDMTHLLNYLLLNKLKWKQNLVIMFLNNVIFSPKHIIKKVVFLELDYNKGMCKVQTLDENKDIYWIHNTRASVTSINNKAPQYLNREGYLFKFEIGGDFLLLDILKDFTWETERYEKGSVNRLTIY